MKLSTPTEQRRREYRRVARLLERMRETEKELGHMRTLQLHNSMSLFQYSILIAMYALLMQTASYRCQPAVLALSSPNWREAEWAESETDIHVQPDLGVLISAISRQSLPGNLLSLIYEIEELQEAAMVI